MKWEKLALGTYARHRPEGGYIIHVDVQAFIDTARGGGHSPREVALQALWELREADVGGVIVAHLNGIKNLPPEMHT